MTVPGQWFSMPQAFFESATERERERAARTFTCPSCGVAVGRACLYEEGYTGPSLPAHTIRYNLAAAAGLVPPLPAIPGAGP